MQSGNVDERMRECVQDNAQVTVTGDAIAIVFTLSSTLKHEPLPPGALAANDVMRERVARGRGSAIVRATRLRGSFTDGLENGKTRARR